MSKKPEEKRQKCRKTGGKPQKNPKNRQKCKKTWKKHLNV